MITLPTTGRWSVKHGQDFLADIVATRNMDFNRPGFAALSKKPVVLFTTDTDSDFTTLQAIVALSSGSSTSYYFITWGNMFSWDASTTALTEDPDLGNAPNFSADSDAVVFNGVLHASGTTLIKSFSSTWTSRITGLSASYPKALCASSFQPYLAVGNHNTVTTYDTGYSTVSTCTLPAQYIVTGIRSRAGNYYISTRAIEGNTARLFVWNGSGTVPNSEWDVHADWIYSIADYQSSIAVLTSAGQLLRFNGGGFDEIAHLPVYDTPYAWVSGASLANSTGKCANRGMVAHGNMLYLNIDGSVSSSSTDAPGPFLANQPSGLWVYDPAVGLYHKGGYAYTKFNSASFTFGSSSFVFAAAHNMQTGDPVYPTTVTGLSGVSANQLYYAIVESTTSIKLAYSKADALAGLNVVVTGTPSGGAIIIDTYDTMGATYTTTFPGAVGLFVSGNPPSVLGSEVMYGGSVTKTDGTTAISSVMSFGRGHNVGSFTTTPLPAAGVTDAFQNLYQYVHSLNLPDAKVVIKYRTLPRYGFPTQYRRADTGLATWVTASSFTVLITAKDFRGAVVGDEVDIIEGAGAGFTAHITDINDTTTTYTVTIDETIPGITAGMKSEVIVDNWKKLDTITSTTTTIANAFASSAVNTINARVQFKFELRGIGLAIRKVLSISKESMTPQ